MPAGSSRTDRWRSLSMLIGGAMLAVCLAVAWLSPEPSPIQARIVLVLTSLGGAFLATGLTGMIELEGKIANMTVRATGSLAIFVPLHFGDASTQVSEQRLPPEKVRVIEELKPSAPASPAGQPPRLEELARDHGYRSFREMSVSATRAELEAVRRRLP